MFFRFYSPIFLLQAFCLYHAYTRNTEHKWFYLIVFLPLIGCLIYLYVHFFGNLKKGIGGASEGVKHLMNSNYQVDRLKKEMDFSDTTENKMRLGDAYISKGRYEEALELLKSCEKGIYIDDSELMLKLLKANYLNNNYTEAIQYGLKLQEKPDFKKSPEKIGFAWAYHYQGNNAAAEKVFKEMDTSFSNYKNRLEYCKFLLETDQVTQAKEKLKHLLNEIDHMDNYERKLIKTINNEIKALYSSVNKLV